MYLLLINMSDIGLGTALMKECAKVKNSNMVENYNYTVMSNRWLEPEIVAEWCGRCWTGIQKL